LLISLALHLVVLFSQGPGAPRHGAEAKGAGALPTTLRGARISLGENARGAATERLPEKHLAGASGTAVRPVAPAGNSKKAPFFVPTVAFADAGLNPNQNAGVVDQPDALLPAGDGEREYRLNLAREARRFKRLPLAVDGRDVEGVVIVTVSTLLAAHRPETHLQKSSGNAALDRAALEMMEEAVKAASMPLELQGRRFRIDVPLEYRLTD